MNLIIRKFILLNLFLLLSVAAFPQTGKIDNIAEQASSVTEFDVNGLRIRAIELFENGTTSLDEVLPYLLQ